MNTTRHQVMRHLSGCSIIATTICLLTLPGLAGAVPADDTAVDRNTVTVDMATFTGDCKVIKAKEGTVRVTLKGVLDQNSTPWRVSTEIGALYAVSHAVAENIHYSACQFLDRCRRQLGVGTDTPMRKVYYDLRSPQENSDTQQLYTKAQGIVGKAGKKPTEFFHTRVGDVILCDMVFNIPANIATPTTKLVSPCYRESDLKDLRDFLVTAAKLYIKTVDLAREDVEQARAMQKAAAQP